MADSKICHLMLTGILGAFTLWFPGGCDRHREKANGPGAATAPSREQATTMAYGGADVPSFLRRGVSVRTANKAVKEPSSTQRHAQELLIEARSAAANITFMDDRIKALIAIATLQERTGDPVEVRNTANAAWDAAKQIQDRDSRAQCFGGIAALFLGIGDHKVANDLFNEAVAILTKDRDFSDFAAAEKWNQELGDIAEAQARAGDPVAASRTASFIRGKEEQSRILSKIAAAQARAGDIPGARDPYAQAVKLVGEDRVSEFGGKIIIMLGIADAQSAAGDMDALKDTLKEAVAEAMKLNDPYMLKEIGVRLARAGNIAGAKAAFNSAVATARQFTLTSDSTGKALGEIALARLTAGDESGAFETATKIADPSQRAVVLARIGIAQAESGKSDAATASFIRAMDAAATVEDLAERAGTRAKIAELRLGAGDAAGAKAAFTTAVNGALQISDPNRQVPALIKIAEGMARSGDVTSAVAIVSRIEDPQTHDRVYGLCAMALARTKDYAKAKAMAAEIRNTTKYDIVSYVNYQEAISQALAGDILIARKWASSLKQPQQQVKALLLVCDDLLKEKVGRR